MTIEPVRHSVTVAAPPDRAFDLFVGSIGRWWPRGRTIARKDHADIVIEPRPGGRWFERADDGEESDWGEVSAIDRPRRLRLIWRFNPDFRYDPDFATTVELIFEPRGSGTHVTLEHRDLEAFGADAERIAGRVNEGWPTMLAHYADFAASRARADQETVR